MAIPTVDQVWADFNADGSVKEPNKQDIRRLLRFIQAIAEASGMKTYPNKAVMDADTTQPDGKPALLWADPVEANNYPTVWVWDDGANQWISGVDRIEPIREQQIVDGLRLAELAQETTPLNFGDSGQFRVINTIITNPDTRYTWSISNGKLTFTQNFAGLLLIGFLTRFQAVKSRSIVVEYEPTLADAVTGFGVCFNPSSGDQIDANNFVGFVWRQTGVVQALRQDGSTVAPYGSNGIVDGNTTGATFVAGDRLKWLVRVDADGTTGAFTRWKNDQFVSSFTVTGLPVGWLGAVARQQGAAGAGAFGPVLAGVIEPFPRRFYIDPSVGQPGGVGTEKSPFKDWTEGINYVNESGRRVDIALRGGFYATPPEIRPGRFDSVSIRGDQGRRPIIRPGTLLTSGWTATPGYADVYERPHVWQGIINSADASGGFVDLSQPDGWWGFTIYNRMPPLGTTLADLAAKPAGEGWYWISAADKKEYIRTKNKLNPNGLSLFRAEWLAGVNLMSPAAADVAAMDIYISGLEIAFPYGHGILAGRTRGTIEDCDIYGAMVLNAVSPNMMSGAIANVRGWRCWNDGINHTDPADFQPPNPTPDRVVRLRVFDCEMTDMVIGDGLSNHQDQDVSIFGGTYARNGKCGIVPVGSATIVGAKVWGNAAEGIGVVVTNAAGAKSSVVSVRGCYLWDNAVGYSAVTPDVNGDGSQNTAMIEILGGSCTGSTQALLRLRNDSPTGGTIGNPCQIRARNLARSGNAAYRQDVTGAHGQVGYVDDVAIPITPGAA
ncbi:hypothetical protein KXR53_17135 [Inquilinus limosus]|uniref:hypothetical protein n=1 Tax=Inquilinus limosus TaxID=171674 RepID=UPI003F179490